MRIAGLIIGILLMILAGIGGIICLLLPSMTNNRISIDESALGLIPAVLISFIGFIVTTMAAVMIMKARKTAAK